MVTAITTSAARLLNIALVRRARPTSAVAVRTGDLNWAARASETLTRHGETRCCRSRSFHRPACRTRCKRSRTCCRPAAAGGASSAPGWPACSGGRRDSTPQTRGSCLPCGHSRPGRRAALVEPYGQAHGSAVSPSPGASASARECAVPPSSVGRPSPPQASPENLVPCRNRSAAVQQALSLPPLLLNLSVLVPLPQASQKPTEKDASEERESEQGVGAAHGTFPSLP
jgi:hypothetical protein